MKEVALFIGLVALVYAVVLIWLPERITAFSLAVPVILLLKDIYNKVSRHRLQQIVFDADNREILLNFKSLISPVQRKNLPFDNINIEVITESSSWKVFEPMTVNFMHGKREVFQVTKSKDGFSLEMLQEIVQMAEKYSIPIIHK